MIYCLVFESLLPSIHNVITHTFITGVDETSWTVTQGSMKVPEDVRSQGQLINGQGAEEQAHRDIVYVM